MPLCPLLPTRISLAGRVEAWGPPECSILLDCPSISFSITLRSTLRLSESNQGSVFWLSLLWPKVHCVCLQTRKLHLENLWETHSADYNIARLLAEHMFIHLIIIMNPFLLETYYLIFQKKKLQVYFLLFLYLICIDSFQGPIVESALLTALHLTLDCCSVPHWIIE